MSTRRAGTRPLPRGAQKTRISKAPRVPRRPRALDLPVLVARRRLRGKTSTRRRRARGIRPRTSSSRRGAVFTSRRRLHVAAPASSRWSAVRSEHGSKHLGERRLFARGARLEPELLDRAPGDALARGLAVVAGVAREDDQVVVPAGAGPISAVRAPFLLIFAASVCWRRPPEGCSKAKTNRQDSRSVIVLVGRRVELRAVRRPATQEGAFLFDACVRAPAPAAGPVHPRRPQRAPSVGRVPGRATDASRPHRTSRRATDAPQRRRAPPLEVPRRPPDDG